MLIFNYYYNAYDEVDVNSINNGNDTSANVGVIVGATIGGVFACIIISVIICVCCKCCREIDDDSEEVEIVHTTTVIEHKDVVYPEGFNPNYPPPQFPPGYDPNNGM
jgi:hypothetical protein